MDVITGQARVALALADGLPLEELELAFQRALDVGVFVDPTRWRDNQHNVTASLQLLQGFRAWVATVQRVQRALGGG